MYPIPVRIIWEGFLRVGVGGSSVSGDRFYNILSVGEGLKISGVQPLYV